MGIDWNWRKLGWHSRTLCTYLLEWSTC